jgi:hypothetical protein
LSGFDGVEAIDHDRLGAERPQHLDFVGARRGRRDLVAAADELRREAPADRPGRSCKKDAHRDFPSLGVSPATPKTSEDEPL